MNRLRFKMLLLNSTPRNLRSIAAAPGLANETLTAKAFYSIPHDARRKVFAVLRQARFSSLQEKRFISAGDDYSYKPFDDNECIFVHIPKTAGVSICQSLFGNLAGGHDPITRYQIIFSEHDFSRYFKFAFVRNPWDRLFSAYNFLRSGGFNERDNQWSQEHLSKFSSFNQFVEQWVTKDNVVKYIHFVPQYMFLCLPSSKPRKPLTDFIGFYENIEEDFSFIKSRLVVEGGTGLCRYNMTSHGNPTDYRNAYTTTTKRIVADVYRQDIEILGYNFDNSSLTSQLNRRRYTNAGC